MCRSARATPPQLDAHRRAGKCDDYRVLVEVRIRRLPKRGRSGEPIVRVGHASYIDKHGGFRQLDCALVHWNCLAGFEKVLNVEICGLADICECFLIGMAPRVAALERWTGGVPGVPAILEFIGLDGHFENVGFRRIYTSSCPSHDLVHQIISWLRNTKSLGTSRGPEGLEFTFTADSV